MLCLWPLAAQAQSTYEIQMQISDEEAVQPRVGEDFAIEVHVKVQSRRGGVPSQFYRNYMQPAFPAGIQVIDRSDSTRSSVAIVNGRYTQEFSHVITYVVRPTQAGRMVIGPASMEADGRLYRSNGLEIQVSPPRAAPKVLLDGQEPDPAMADDEFLQVTVSRSELYVGQPVVVSWWLYTTSRLTERPQSDPPDSPDFSVNHCFPRTTRTKWNECRWVPTCFTARWCFAACTGRSAAEGLSLLRALWSTARAPVFEHRQNRNPHRYRSGVRCQTVAQRRASSGFCGGPCRKIPHPHGSGQHQPQGGGCGGFDCDAGRRGAHDCLPRAGSARSGLGAHRAQWFSGHFRNHRKRRTGAR